MDNDEILMISKSIPSVFPKDSYDKVACNYNTTGDYFGYANYPNYSYKCKIFDGFLYSYYSFTVLLTVAIIIIIDLYLLKKIKDQNKNKIKLNNKDSKLKNDLKIKEERITKMVIFNAIILIFLRSPEILATIFNIYIYSKESYLFEFSLYFSSNLNELFDFLFLLHSTFQFFLFYKFNKNFKESFNDRILVLIIPKLRQ